MKSKRLICTIISFVLMLTMLVTGCGPAGMDDSGDPGDKIRLRVSVFQAGEGIKWLEDIAAAYEKENPNVKVVIKGDAGMEGIAQNVIGSDNVGAMSDIYSCINDANFYNNINNGRLEPLNDVYQATVGDGKTVEDVVLPSAAVAMKANNTYYAIPWHKQAVGIIYNKGMFEEKGWEVPTTFSEYYELCNTICATTNVAPLGYCGGVTDGYFQEFLLNLMFQYGGKTAMKEFYAAESAEVYKQEGRVKAYETVGRMIAGEYDDGEGNKKSWVLDGSSGFDHNQINREFIKGNCAMMIGGSWFPIESATFLERYPNFKAEMMPTPWIQDSKTSLDGGTEYANITESTRLVIPKLAANKETAKDFLRFMNTKEMRKLFIEVMEGTPRPTIYSDINLDDCNLSDFGKSVVKIVENGFFDDGVGRNQMFINSTLKHTFNYGELCKTFNKTLLTEKQIIDRAKSLAQSDYEVALAKFEIQ